MAFEVSAIHFSPGHVPPAPGRQRAWLRLRALGRYARHMERLPRLVDSPAELDAMLSTLRDAPLIAVDTESNAFHAYRPRVCLIQIADREREWAVDPHAVDTLEPLGVLLNQPETVKVLHAAEGDIRVLRRDFGFGVTPVFDTMVAARILAYRRVGLADLLSEHFGLTLDKRYQRHDWGQRPISPPALRYAAADVRHLPVLYDLLYQQLMDANALEEAAEEFARVTRAVPEPRDFDPENFWRVKGTRDLPPSGRAILRELYVFRDGRARAQDRPPIKVLGDDALIAISTARPVDTAGLRRAGLSPLQVDRYGNALLSAVRRGLASPPPRPPRPSGPPPDPRVIARYDALRQWRKDRAGARGVEPDVIVPNSALRALSHATVQSPEDVARTAELGPWKREHYAGEMLRVLQEVDRA
jgi:ribonuclease D